MGEVAVEGGGGGLSSDGQTFSPSSPRCSAAVVGQEPVKGKKEASFSARVLVREELQLVGRHLPQLIKLHV